MIALADKLTYSVFDVSCETGFKPKFTVSLNNVSQPISLMMIEPVIDEKTLFFTSRNEVYRCSLEMPPFPDHKPLFACKREITSMVQCDTENIALLIEGTEIIVFNQATLTVTHHVKKLVQEYKCLVVPLEMAVAIN